MKVEIYSDVVCPWCYIGERRFTRALEEFEGADEVEVVFRPFQLDPDAPEEAVPLREYLAKRYGGSSGGMTKQAGDAAAGEGIRIDWEGAQAVNTFTAHRLMRLAEREHGTAVQRALAEALFELHFTRGGNVADPAELADAAAGVGMDAGRVRSYLESDEGVPETEEALEAARRLGVRAVPTFVFDGQYAVQGAQPVPVFRRALEEVERSTTAREG